LVKLGGVRGAGPDLADKAFFDQQLQIALKRSSVHFQFPFALSHSRFAGAQQETKKGDGPIFQSALSSPSEDHVSAYDVFGCNLHLSHLSAQTLREVFKPAGQVHPPFAHALERLVISGPVAVAILADREEPFEIVAGPVETKRGKQARRSPIAINKGMNMDELKLRDTRHEVGGYSLTTFAAVIAIDL
jgi:hypothetical protein